MTVLPLESLGKIERPHRVGYATANFPEMPPGAPGRLEFGPLRLCGMESFEPDYEGFSMHPHANVEVVTVMVRGAFSHRDTLGRGSRLEADDVQVMSAGTGLEHEEMTHGHCTGIQLMFEPGLRDTEPRVLDRTFARLPDQWVTLVSNVEGEGALPIRQDASIRRANCSAGTRLPVTVRTGRAAYLLVVSGRIELDGVPAEVSERILLKEAGAFEMVALQAAEVLWIDLVT